MSNFVKKLVKSLNEWIERDLDEHLMDGIDSNSFIELLTKMRSKYIEELEDCTNTLNKFLNHVGYTGDNDNRQPADKNALKDLNALKSRIMWAIDPHYWMSITKNKDHLTALLEFKRLYGMVTAYLKGYDSLVDSAISNLKSLNYRVPPEIGVKFKRLGASIVYDFNLIMKHWSTDAYGNKPGGDAIYGVLIETPEMDWLPEATEDDINKIKKLHPHYAEREAAIKISKILEYGPNYRNCSEILKLIADKFKLSATKLLERAEEYDDEEEEIAAFKQWLEENAADYGISN